MTRLPPEECSSLGWMLWRVFLYHGEDSPIIHHSCPPRTSRPFYVAELTSAFCIFLRMKQTVDLATPNVPAISLMDLFCFWSRTIVFHLYREILWPHDVGSQQQLPNANDTLRISSRPFTCLIDVEITKEKPTSVHETAFEAIVQLLMVPWKGGEVHIKEL